jgi:V8-like Glu-specific endopeptidase
VPGLAAVAALAALPPAASARGARETGAAIVDQVDRSAASVRSYWTPARMRAAKPASLLAAKPGAAARAVPAQRRQLADPVPHVKRRPTRTGGKVFFSAGLYDYECSGTAVKAPIRSLVITAGHCGYLLLAPGLGDAIHNWEFVPAYNQGRAPFGEWAATKLAAPAGWIASLPLIGPTGEPSGDSRYDVAAARVGRRGGRTLQSVVGGRRVAFNQPRAQQYEAIGYPAQPPFGGGREYDCSSGYQGSDTSLGEPAPIRISCDMNGGSSGGGWLDGRGRLVSVISYSYLSDPNSLYGPYFGGAIRDFYAAVKGG